MMRTGVHTARRLLRRAGIEAVRYVPANFEHLRRAELLRSGAVTLLVDGGAGRGFYAATRRREGYEGRIAGFEPRAAIFAELERRASPDPLWQVYPLALSDEAGEAVIYEHGAGSSLHPNGDETGEETVRLTTLDGMLDELAAADDTLMLKLDLEGHELHALRGAAKTARTMRRRRVRGRSPAGPGSSRARGRGRTPARGRLRDDRVRHEHAYARGLPRVRERAVRAHVVRQQRSARQCRSVSTPGAAPRPRGHAIRTRIDAASLS